MHGNVYEWVWDWKSDAGSYGSFTDPQGAEKGLYKIKRGGSWLSGATQIRASDQSLQEAPQRGSFLGLRAAMKYFPNRTPKDLASVAPLELLPNEPTATPVGEFTAIDLDADPLTYQLVSGTGDTHNSKFTLLANGTLSTAQSLGLITDWKPTPSGYGQAMRMVRLWKPSSPLLKSKYMNPSTPTMW